MKTKKTAKATAARQRAIQQDIDAKPKEKTAAKKSGAAKKKPVQAGARRQPEPPMPAQHQAKPGMEHELVPRPRYEAPDYSGSGNANPK